MSITRTALSIMLACSLLACAEPVDEEPLLDDGLTSGFADPTIDGASRDEEEDEDDEVDPAELGDDFEDPALVGWEIFRNDAADIMIEDGRLLLEARENTAWVHDQTSILVWKEIEGDFMATASVRAAALEDPESPPPPIFRFGGLMARSSDDENENNLSIALGTDDEPSVETKSTVDGDSTWKGPPWPGASGDVRICRLGTSFLLYVREPDGDWEMADAFARPDLPDVLEVGPMAYNDSPTPDLRVSFDFVHFAAIESQGDCER